MPNGKKKSFAAGTATGVAITKTAFMLKERAKKKAKDMAQLKQGIKVSQKARETNKKLLKKDLRQGKNAMSKQIMEAKPKNPSFPGQRGPKVSVIKRMINSLRGVGNLGGVMAPKVNPVKLRQRMARDKKGS